MKSKTKREKEEDRLWKYFFETTWKSIVDNSEIEVSKSKILKNIKNK